MIDLPIKLEQAIKNSRVTSLYPVIRFFKNVKIDEKDLWGEAESVNISIKSTTLDNINYDPILLNEPNIKSSAEIIDNKYTISSVDVKISNIKYNNKVFSDEIQSLLNAVCQIYYTANGIDSLDDSLLVYTGIVRRFKQSRNQVSLMIEDASDQILDNEIPTQIVSDEGIYSKKDIGNPYPMVYGFVDKSPLIKQFSGLNDIGELENKLAQLHIDKPSVFIRGLWDNNQLDYNLPSEHRLFTQGILSTSNAHLYVYETNFTPIHRTIPSDWGFGQFTANSNESKRTIYGFNLQFTNESESAIILFTGAIDGNSNLGIPSRIYRPIEKCEFFTFNDNNNPVQGHSINKIYGFTEFTSGQLAYQKYYKDENIYDDVYYQNNWDNSQTWWQPTACNENLMGGVFSSIDKEWIRNGRIGEFPVERLQDGTLGTGLWFTAKNEDGARDDGAKSGGCFVRMILKDNVGEHDCGTAVYYDAECHSFSYMDQPTEMPYHAQFWTNREVIEQLDQVSDLIDNDNCETVGEIKDVGFPVTSTSGYVPNPQFEDVVYTDQVGDEDSVRKLTGKAIANTFIKTNEFDSIQFGIPQYNKLGNAPGGHTGYNSTQLFNAWVVQDAIIQNPINQDFYGSVVGRSNLLNNPNITDIYRCQKIDVEPVGDGIYDEFTYNLRIGNNVEESATFAQTIDQFIEESTEQLFLDIITNGIWKNSYDNFERPQINEDGFYYIKIIDLPAGSYTGEGEYQVAIDFFIRDVLPVMEAITNSNEILEDILKNELQFNGDVIISPTEDDWQFSFTLNERINTKEFFEDFFKSTLQIPSFNQFGQFKFIPIKQIISSYNDISIIKNEDIIKYSYDITDIDDIYTSVNVKYHKNYATGKYDKETGYELIDGNGNLYDNYQELSEYMYTNQNLSYNLDYYKLKHSQTKLEFTSDYIRDEDTARKLQKKLLLWYANQHLKLKLELPIKYLNYEVGDYVKFTELIDGKLAFGYDYTIPQARNGQLIYDVFFITGIQKKLDKVTLNLVQVHRGEYGYPNNVSEDPNIPLADDGSIDGIGNHTLPDPSDNPNYDNENITDEFEEDVEAEDFFNCYLLNNQNNIDNIITSVINTNINEDWDYKIYVSNVVSSQGYIDFPEGSGIINDRLYDGIYNEENNIGNDLVYHYKSVSNMFENFNGTLELSKKYEIQLETEDDYARIDFIIKIYNSQQSEYLTFYQEANYVEEYEVGDVNNDTIINILDIVLLIQYIIGNEQFNQSQINAADINGDNVINVLDIVTLINNILE